MPWYLRILAMIGAVAIMYALKNGMDSAAGYETKLDSEFTPGDLPCFAFTVYILWVWTGTL